MYMYFEIKTERRKHFRALSRSSPDSTCVATRMLDTIISMEDVPGRFSALVKLFQDEFGQFVCCFFFLFVSLFVFFSSS
jgi:hypothetical protein